MDTPMKTSMSSFSLGSGSNDAPADSTSSDREGLDDLVSIVDNMQSRLLPIRGSGLVGEAVVLGDALIPEWGAGGGLPPITAAEKENMVLALIDIGGGTLEAKWSYLKLTP
jgi:hypothetical protein